MEKNIVKINESTLRKIVAESVKTVLNEIGDTPAGRAMLDRAAGKASDLGRRGQSLAFSHGLQKATETAFGEGATYNTYKYSNWKERPIILSVIGPGQVTFPGMDGRNSQTYTLEDVFSRGMEDSLKTTDFKTARKLAKWCQERMPQDNKLYNKLCDWHTWAAQ
jgi:hypothetical protein